jgi:acetolactate synthase I/II/III large subunit
MRTEAEPEALAPSASALSRPGTAAALVGVMNYAIGSSPAVELAPESDVARCFERVFDAHGLSFVATVPGGPLMPMLRALHSGRRIRTVLTRHEGGATLLADGYYRVTRRPAVVALTAGPGVCNALTGIALAYAEHTPMIVISAQVPTHWVGRCAAQEMDTAALLRPVTKESVQLADPSRAQSTLQRLVHLATDGRPGPVHLSVPLNLWSAPAQHQPSVRRVSPPSGNSDSAEHVAKLLKQARRPCVLVGYGAVQAGAERELIALAATFPHVRFACTPRAKGAFPEDHAQAVGVFGFAGHARATELLLGDADLVLVLGSRLGEMTSNAWDERLGRRRLIQVDIEPTELGRNFAVELGVAGDIRHFLLALLDGLGEARVLSARPAVSTPREAKLAPVPPLPTQVVKPSRLLRELNSALSGEEHVFVDIGNCMAWAIHQLTRNRPRRWHLNLVFGCMGHALPAAIGGALGGGRRNVVLVGDAAFAMTGFELHTAVENNVPLVVIVLNDSGHGMVEMGCEVQFGAGAVPSYRFGRRIDACGIAIALGCRAKTVCTEADLVSALACALEFEGTTLLDVHIDSSERPPFGARMSALKRNFGGQASNEDGT